MTVPGSGGAAAGGRKRAAGCWGQQESSPELGGCSGEGAAGLELSSAGLIPVSVELG